MPVNQEALQNLLVEMDNQLKKTQAELSMCDLQLDRVNTNISTINSTTTSLNQICSVAEDETVYQGVGKAFMTRGVGGYLDEISRDMKEFEESKKGLLIKKNYLQTTIDKTVLNMTQIVKKP